MITLLGSLLQCIGQKKCTNFTEIVIFCVSIIIFKLFILCYFNDSFYTLHSIIFFLPYSFMNFY